MSRKRRGNPDAPADGGTSGARRRKRSNAPKTPEEVTVEVDAQPVHCAFAALVAGKMDDGRRSLDRTTSAGYGEGMKQLPRDSSASTPARAG